jgi:hypothetical protein
MGAKPGVGDSKLQMRFRTVLLGEDGDVMSQYVVTPFQSQMVVREERDRSWGCMKAERGR